MIASIVHSHSKTYADTVKSILVKMCTVRNIHERDKFGDDLISVIAFLFTSVIDA